MVKVRSVVAGLERRTEIASCQSMRSTVCKEPKQFGLHHGQKMHRQAGWLNVVKAVRAKIPMHATRQDKSSAQHTHCNAFLQPFSERLLLVV